MKWVNIPMCEHCLRANWLATMPARRRSLVGRSLYQPLTTISEPMTSFGDEARVWSSARTRDPKQPTTAWRGLRPRLTWIVSFEALLAILLVPGFRVASDKSPIISPALIVGVVPLLVCMGILVLRYPLAPRRSITLVLFGALFLLYVTSTLAHSPSEVWGPQKVELLWLLNFSCLVGAAFVIGPRRDRVVRFVVLMACVGCGLAALWLPLALVTSGGSRPSLLGAEYLLLSHWMGVGALLTLGYTLLVARHGVSRAVGTAVFIAVTLAMLSSGGRGPLLALAASSTILMFGRVPSRSWRLPRRKSAVRRLAVIFLLALAALVPIAESRSLLTITRLSVLLSPTRGSSAEERIQRAEVAISMWRSDLVLGTGIGSYPVLAGFGDVREYPHNLLLEVGAETGVIGVALLVLLLGFGLRSLGGWRTLRQDPLRVIILALVIYWLVVAQISGDLVDNRALLVCTALCVVGAALPGTASRLQRSVTPPRPSKSGS